MEVLRGASAWLQLAFTRNCNQRDELVENYRKYGDTLLDVLPVAEQSRARL